MINKILGRGVAAGAAGVTALNAVTYLDMALRGRPASDTPERTVDAITAALGGGIPGGGEVRRNRRSALGALSGIGTGVAVGVAASVARAAGFRLPAPVGVLITAAAAMAASDVPMTALGVSDPRSWKAKSWASDLVPHLAYGLVTRSVVHAQSTAAERRAPQLPPSATLLVRATALGVASGGRSTLGLAAPVLTGRRLPRAASSLAALMVAGELVVDKLPATPSRLQTPAATLRGFSGAGGAVALAHREQADPTVPALLGAAGAAVGSWSGAMWRSWAKGRMPDWQGALIEDAVALGLAAIACLPHRNASTAPTQTYAELMNAG